MRRISGAFALGYVVLAAVENMGLLGATDAEVEAAYADTALGIVTTGAGALSLACYAVFAALVARAVVAPALVAVTLAGAGSAAAASSTSPACRPGPGSDGSARSAR